MDQLPENGYSSNVAQDYELLMDTMQVSVSKHLLNDYFTMVWSNNFYYQLIGYEKEEYVALFHNRPDEYYKYHHYEEELDKINDIVVETLQKGGSAYNLISRMPVKGGGHKWVQMHGNFTKNMMKGYPIAYTVIIDVDDFVNMQKAQSITYNNMPGFVARYLIKDYLHIELLEANDQFSAFFGKEKIHSSQDPFFRMNVEANKSVLIPLLDLVKRGEHIRFLCKLQNRRGETMWMQANGDCVDWIDGNPVYQIIYIDVTDVTELKEMQTKLEEQAQQLKDALAGARRANIAKRDFLSRMSHEIRTPMNAIIGMTTIAAAHIGEKERMEDCLIKINASSRHLLSLINDILDMSKIEDGKLSINHQPFYLQQIMESITTIIYPQAAAQGLEFKITVQGLMDEELIGDSMRASQILINLLSNAVKFTPENGKVHLEVKQLSSRGKRVRLGFTVSDTGRGMTREFLERIYEPFEQENAAGGTGLGMPITKNLVNLLGGTISVKSKVNEGTVFTIELPFDLSGEHLPLLYPSMGTLRVLVSDDDPDDCAYASLLLDKFGIKAKNVPNGHEAVEEIRKCYDMGECYDICLIDWKMSDLDGVETTRQIRSIVGMDTMIIILTAYDYSEIETAAREAGANLFLSKPLFASSLYNMLLNAPELGQALPRPQGIGKSARLEGHLIFIAEDNELNLEIAEEILKMAGAEVKTARNGTEAVEWFLSPEGRMCDAILMDIQMPVMDGYEAAKEIRGSQCKNACSIPIIAMTANAFQEDVAAALEAGMNAHIAKPIDVEALYETLEKAFKNQEMQ